MEINKAGIDPVKIKPPFSKPAETPAKETTDALSPYRLTPDRFRWSNKDLTPEGRLPIIIQTDCKESMDKCKEVVLKKSKGEITGGLKLLKGVTAEIDPKNLKYLFEEIPEDAKVFLDAKVTLPRPIVEEPSKGGDVDAKLNVSMPTAGVDKLWEKGYTGKGVGIAVIDTGVYPHKDFVDPATGQSRIIAFKDFANSKKEPYDDHGHGTHVSGIAAGNGAASAGKYKGAAPDANIVGVKVLDKNGSGRFSDVIKGIQWAIQNKDKYNIKVMSMSLGGTVRESYKDDPVNQAVEKAVEAGIVSVIAAGNEGPDAETIATPGNDPEVVTVGALDDSGTLDKADDDIARFSSRGPTPIDGITKPDVIFPGVKITAPLAPGSSLDKPSIPHEGEDYITISGTSMATPGTAGTVADLLQANPKLTPQKVKEILMSSADKLKNYDANTAGKGVVDAQEALEKALSA